ncbi:DUF4189 domain-containing protein [Lysobacter enzymogenes]|uniref:DUF4189 domain-containing protein n=1 Tax=Lysobacter enzymogenes TaxID=69 RepID=UPI0019D27671|nr:DUF4189 domain-containing protein [Lysobacter enzymogenes]
MKTRILWMTFALSVLPAGNSFGCPPGEWLQQGAGWQMCVPIPGMQNRTSGPPSSAPVWATRWGAIAVNESDIAAGVGSASGMVGKRLAESAALRACREKGINGCKVKFTYKNQCAAIVWGDHGSNVSGAASIEMATRVGLDKCVKDKDTNCEVYFTECSYPERLR